MYNVGIVGLGHVARHHIAALGSSPDFRLIAGCDTDARTLDVLDSSIHRFTSLEQMLALPGLDVVVVASPNQTHVDHGISVMAAGKWLVMEKPLAETRAEFERFHREKARLAGNCTLALHAAYGVEFLWFRNQIADGKLDLQRFDARFYDPYFEEGRMVSSARSLGGSWTDSGINALSVICRLVDPKSLIIRDARMTRVAGSDCREVQGTVDFEIRRQGSPGFGSIDTNWTLGRDSKATEITLAGSGRRYLLDHSRQSVLQMEEDEAKPLFACANGLPRLTNHYIGVFADLARQLKDAEDNFPYAQVVHDYLYRGTDAVGSELGSSSPKRIRYGAE